MIQQYSQKYTVVCFFELQEKASNFSASEWPLHVTILDTFKTEWPLPTLCNELRRAALTVTPFNTIPTEEVMLGENQDVSVKLLKSEGGMSALHTTLMELANEGSFVFNTPEFVGNGFLPHATNEIDGQVEVGQLYPLDGISLVDMFPNGDHRRREVVNTFVFEH